MSLFRWIHFIWVCTFCFAAILCGWDTYDWINIPEWLGWICYWYIMVCVFPLTIMTGMTIHDRS